MKNTSWSWFGQSKEEKAAAERELAACAAQAQALRDHQEKIALAVARDPRFRVCTFDGLNWICPYTGRIVRTPFGFEEVARDYLFQQKPWKQQPSLRPALLSRAIAWRYYIQEAIRKDQRLRSFSGDRWLNPFTGRWIEGVPRGPDGSITPQTLGHLATALNACEQSQRRSFLPPKELEAVLRSITAQYRTPLPEDLGRSTGSIASQLDAVFPDDEAQLDGADFLRLEDLPKEADRSRNLGSEDFAISLDADWSDEDVGAAEEQAYGVQQPASDSHEYDEQRARDVQSRLLGPVPEIPGFVVGLHFAPHDAISGDFYDCVQLSDGRTLFAIGDVSGHGVQAGLVVQSLVKSLRFICRQHSDLTQIVRLLNQEVGQDVLQDQFVTAFFAVLEPQSMQLECVWLGHHPLVAARTSTGSLINLIGRPGAALGLLKSELFARTVTPFTYELEIGDVILQYTDGASEAMSPDGEEYGEGRLYGSFVAQLLRDETIDIQNLIDGIAADVRAWSADTLADDMTILGIAVAGFEETG